MKGKNKIVLGWQEWCALPSLNIPAIKAKIDTGAKTSALHAFNVETFRRRRLVWVRFDLHPIQHVDDTITRCEVPVWDYRKVISSNGHFEHRYVIKTPLVLKDKEWDIEVTLTNRDILTFRMLLGREALKSGILVEPSKKLLLGKLSTKELNALYRKSEC